MDGKHDVICIEAKKVFDFCFQEHRVERFFSTDITDTNVVVDCQINTQDVTCREVSPRQTVDPKRNKFLICLAITVPVTLRVMNGTTGAITIINQTVTILKQVVLCIPPGTEVQCEVTGNCCCVFEPNVEGGQINCVFDFCIVIKSKATVHILVPTLGMCMPKECRSVTAGCPPMVPKDDRFKDDRFKDDRFKDDRFKDDRFKDDRFKDDRFKDGRFKDDRFKDCD